MRDQLIAAVRGLRHRRGVAATVILTLTLGIGANTAIFSAVDAVLLKPRPYPDADRLVVVYELNLGQKHATQLVAPVRIEEWNRANRSFTGLAGTYFENMTDRREIGVRMALGARAGQILRSVVAQAATVTGAGIAAGLAGAFALTRCMTTLVFGIGAADPLTFAAVPALLAAVALAAALIPARRAAAVDPMRAFREE